MPGVLPADLMVMWPALSTERELSVLATGAVHIAENERFRRSGPPTQLRIGCEWLLLILDKHRAVSGSRLGKAWGGVGDKEKTVTLAKLVEQDTQNALMHYNLLNQPPQDASAVCQQWVTVAYRDSCGRKRIIPRVAVATA
jgi:hypothetical protein